MPRNQQKKPVSNFGFSPKPVPKNQKNKKFPCQLADFGVATGFFHLSDVSHFLRVKMKHHEPSIFDNCKLLKTDSIHT